MKKTAIIIGMILTVMVIGLILFSAYRSSEAYRRKKASEIVYSVDETVNIELLKEKYPEYFDISDFKGIEVYIWQLAEEEYRCGIMPGTNRNKTDEEIRKLQWKSLSVDETKAILNELGVSGNEIVVIPITQPYSSYLYEIDDEYTERVSKLFSKE